MARDDGDEFCLSAGSRNIETVEAKEEFLFERNLVGISQPEARNHDCLLLTLESLNRIDACKDVVAVDFGPSELPAELALGDVVSGLRSIAVGLCRFHWNDRRDRLFVPRSI